MDANLTKCFICDVECTAEEKFLGTNIARTLTMPMTAMLAKCLRTIVDAENEYFCSECTRKIEEYDQMVQLSLQIETELYELFRRKPTDSCYLLDAEIIDDQDASSDGLVETEHLKIDTDTITEQISEHEDNELNETYDEMVVEYLDDYETQSDDANLIPDEKDTAVIKVEEQSVSEEISQEKDIDDIKPVDTIRKVRSKKVGVKKQVARKKLTRSVGTTDTTEIDLNCHLCSFAATRREELEEHKTLEHFQEIKRLVCDICGRAYKSKSALCVHLGMHNGRSSHGMAKIISSNFTSFIKYVFVHLQSVTFAEKPSHSAVH